MSKIAQLGKTPLPSSLLPLLLLLFVERISIKKIDCQQSGAGAYGI